MRLQAKRFFQRIIKPSEVMKIVHRVAFNANEEQLHKLESMGIDYDNTDSYITIFLVEDGDPIWPNIADLLTQWKVLEQVLTEFGKKELASAHLLRMGPNWHHGYPQPEGDFGYQRMTYDDTDYCAVCGTGLKQQAPFRMLREPKWGTKQILQLNWVMDEFFVTPEAWELVFRPLGIDSLPVLHHKTGRPLKSVVQLQISARTTSPVASDSFIVKRCPVCHRDKLTGVSPGRFPHVTIPEGIHVTRTPEYFGNDCVAFNEIILSAELYQAITSYKLKGACFYVVAEPGQALR